MGLFFALGMIIVAGLSFIYSGKLIYPITIILALIIGPNLTRYFVSGNIACLYDLAAMFVILIIAGFTAAKVQKICDKMRATTDRG